jgi:CheY-like chemotaxis protein
MDSGVERPKTATLADRLKEKIVGQSRAVDRIVPHIQMYQAGLTANERPIATFLLLGPTGTGKTRTIEVLAEALHGSSRRYLRIDCGEFQLEQEVAKLIGSPPGYLGHRETAPMVSKQRLSEITTPECDISLVLFDEIEKAAPSLARLLLGVLDKGRLTLGDNTVIGFEKTLIFFTSNLGAREMMRELKPCFGFEVAASVPRGEEPNVMAKLEAVGLNAVRKHFSAEFVNRLDAVITYQALSTESLRGILQQQILELQEHVNCRLGPNGFSIQVTEPAREFLLNHGVSTEYGARELKRTVYRCLTQPLATMVAEDRVRPKSSVIVGVDPSEQTLQLDIRVSDRVVCPIEMPKSKLWPAPTILIVDDNEGLVKFLATVMQVEKWNILTATTATQAFQLAEQHSPDVGLIDYMLPDIDGLALSKHLQLRLPALRIILMTGSEISSYEYEASLGPDTPLVRKPFLVHGVLDLIRSRLPVAARPATGSVASI